MLAEAADGFANRIVGVGEEKKLKEGEVYERHYG
jgi:hypothetical protein